MHLKSPSLRDNFADQSAVIPKILEVFENLSKRLRSLENLPLHIVSVQPLSAGNIPSP